jgi:hypothetical protein
LGELCYFSGETKRHLKKALLAIPGVIWEDGDAFLLNHMTVRKAIHSTGSVPTTNNTLREILNYPPMRFAVCHISCSKFNATDLSFIKKTTEYVKSKIRVHLA